MFRYLLVMVIVCGVVCEARRVTHSRSKYTVGRKNYPVKYAKVKSPPDVTNKDDSKEDCSNENDSSSAKLQQHHQIPYSSLDDRFYRPFNDLTPINSRPVNSPSGPGNSTSVNSASIDSPPVNLHRGLFAISDPAEGTCLCVAENRVNILDNACGDVIGQTGYGSCYNYTGQKQRCRLGSTTYEFFRLQYGGWVESNYLYQSAYWCDHRNQQHPSLASLSSGCPTIVKRSVWGTRKEKIPKSLSWISNLDQERQEMLMNLSHRESPFRWVVIHHTKGISSSCSERAECIRTIQRIQNYHMDRQGLRDIRYNFLVGEDGRVYEGVGWYRKGIHVKKSYDRTMGIAVMGNFDTRSPNQEALIAVRQLIACGVLLGKISSDYILHGHRDLDDTNCPGNALYAIVKTWPNFMDFRIFMDFLKIRKQQLPNS